LAIVLINAQLGSEDILCEGRVFQPNCTSGVLRIISAIYGRSDSWFCGGPDKKPWSSNCEVNVQDTVKQFCQGKPSCVVPVTGQDVCQGFARYLRVTWICEASSTQSSSNNRGANIVISASSKRTNPVPLHALTIGGSALYVFIDPAPAVSQVRWYLDDTTKVYTTETSGPWDLLGGRTWDTVATKIPDGRHRIVAGLTFLDGTSGYVDAIFNIKNGNQQPVVARATENTNAAFTQSTNGSSTNVVTEDQIIPWSLFGFTCLVIIVLSIVLGVVSKKKSSDDERV